MTAPLERPLLPPPRRIRAAHRADLRTARRARLRTAAWLAALAAVLCAAPAHAERDDRNKPVNVEADSMTYDDVKQVNVFSGRVVITKGTIVLRADRVVLRKDADGYQYATATGEPATFRQKRDRPDEYVAGSARQIEYDGKTERFTLRERANLKRLERERVTDEVHGNLIVYDSRNEFFSVDGGGPATATPENPSGRVRVVIQPRDAAAPTPSPAPLQPDRELQAPRR